MAKQPQAATAPAPTILGTMLPNMASVYDATQAGIQDRLNAGEYAQAVGRGITGAVKYPLALAADVAQPINSAVGVLGNVARGIVGSTGDTTVVPVAAPAAAKAAAPVVAAQNNVAAGVGAAPPVSPQQQIMAAVSSVLSRPWSINDLTHVAGVLPQVAQSVARIPRGRDAAADTAVQDANQAFADQVARSTADSSSGKTTADAAKADIQRAHDARMEMLLRLAGANPMQEQMAEVMRQAQAGNQ